MRLFRTLSLVPEFGTIKVRSSSLLYLMTMVRFIETAEWEPAVGRFVVQFNMIEADTDHALSGAYTSPVFDLLLEDSLSKRIKFLYAFADSDAIKPSIRKTFDKIKSELFEVVGKRNIVAHGTVFFRALSTGPSLAWQHEINTRRNKRNGITFTQLNVLNKKVERISAIYHNACESLYEQVALHRNGRFDPYEKGSK